MLTQIAQGHLRRQRGSNQLSGYQAKQRLLTVRDGLQPGGTIKRWAEKIVVSLFCDPGVQPHPHPNRPCSSPFLRMKRQMPVQGGVQPIHGRVESSAESITYRLEDIAVVALGNLAQEFVVALQRDLHRVWLCFPQLR